MRRKERTTQVEFGFTNWGGRRLGAGRNLAGGLHGRRFEGRTFGWARTWLLGVGWRRHGLLNWSAVLRPAEP